MDIKNKIWLCCNDSETKLRNFDSETQPIVAKTTWQLSLLTTHLESITFSIDFIIFCCQIETIAIVATKTKYTTIQLPQRFHWCQWSQQQDWPLPLLQPVKCWDPCHCCYKEKRHNDTMTRTTRSNFAIVATTTTRRLLLLLSLLLPWGQTVLRPTFIWVPTTLLYQISKTYIRNFFRCHLYWQHFALFLRRLVLFLRRLVHWLRQHVLNFWHHKTVYWHLCTDAVVLTLLT